MQLVDYSQIQGGVISYLQTLPLGLSTLPTAGGGTLPSVIKDRQKMPRPPFPYIVVDMELSVPEGGTNLRDVYVDESDVVHYVSEHTVTAVISCYGDTALPILHTVQQYLLVDQERNKLRNYTGSDAVYQRMTEVTDKPLFLETDHIDGAEMSIIFTVVADFFNPDAEYSIISTVEATGTYFTPDGQERLVSSIIVSDTGA